MSPPPSRSAPTRPRGAGSATSTERLLDGLPETLPDVHLSLAITGGSAEARGRATPSSARRIASLAVDLIDGADNWRLVTAAPPERGIVCGALAVAGRSRRRPGGPAVGRRSRVGRPGRRTASAWRPRRRWPHLSWSRGDGQAATASARRRASRCCPPEERLASIDPRAVDSRSAAMGRYDARALDDRRPADDRGRAGASAGTIRSRNLAPT